MNPLKPLSVFSTDRQLTSARFSADGSLLAAGCVDSTVRCWRVGEKQIDPLPNLQGHHGWVTSVAFHPQGNRLFTADSWGQLRCQLLSDAAPKVLWQIDTAHDGWLRQLAVAPDGASVATCGRDSAVRVWSAEGKLLAEHRHENDVFAVAFALEDRQVVFGDQRGQLHLWDFAADKLVRQFDASILFKTDRMQDMGGLRVLAFAEEGKLLLAAGAIPEKGGTIQSIPVTLAFDFATGALQNKFTHGVAKDGFIEDLVVHPAGYLMAVTSGDPGNGKLLRFRVTEKEAFDSATPLPNCQALALHPDGRRFIVVSTNRDSNGNGRLSGKDGAYPPNNSPVSMFELPTT
jgi:sugar lactone lactonase YvrE